MRCPVCQRESPPARENRFAPFCCEHCKLVDLSKWMNEEYRIAGPPRIDDDDSGPSEPGTSGEPPASVH